MFRVGQQMSASCGLLLSQQLHSVKLRSVTLALQQRTLMPLKILWLSSCVRSSHAASCGSGNEQTTSALAIKSGSSDTLILRFFELPKVSIGGASISVWLTLCVIAFAALSYSGANCHVPGAHFLANNT